MNILQINDHKTFEFKFEGTDTGHLKKKTHEFGWHVAWLHVVNDTRLNEATLGHEAYWIGSDRQVFHQCFAMLDLRNIQ